MRLNQRLTFFLKYTIIFIENERERKMNREKYLEKIIQIWGFEHPNTIKFAKLIEAAPDEDIIEVFWNLVKVF